MVCSCLCISLQGEISIRERKDEYTPYMWEHLPDDVIHEIHTIVLDEKHITARLLLKRARFLLIRAMNQPFGEEVEHHLDEAISTWRGIVDLACYDYTISKSALSHHDCWLQTLEDPYDMRIPTVATMDKFTYEFEPILHIAGRCLFQVNRSR